MSATPQLGAFASRHIGPREPDVASMLEVIGHPTLDALIDAAVPEAIRSHRLPSVDGPLSEVEAVARMRRAADKNDVYRSVIGMGYYGTITPGVIQRNVLENPGWYTAYTPYQPEISQGRLEALLNFQTAVTDLTGLEIANSSLLDEGTAAAEAMTLIKRVGRNKAMSFFIDEDTHPQTIEVVTTRAVPLGYEIIVGDPETDLDLSAVFGVLLQYPGSSGQIRDIAPIIETAHAAGVLVAVATDLLASTLLTPVGELGADVAIGSSQRFGVPMMFGGPHAAFMATRDAYKRSMPGRLVGVSVDSAGRTGLRLTLQTREQHIRRDKATSNICTAQVLLAVMAGLYAVHHGPAGLSAIANQIHDYTNELAARLKAGGLTVKNDSWFDTLTIEVEEAEKTLAKARHHKINLRSVDSHTVGVSLDETISDDDIEALCEIFGVAPTTAARPAVGVAPLKLKRTSTFLEHPTFHRYRSETEMLRYLRRLQDKDIALDRSMIPLGSCTMKLNASAEMAPITWPEFTDIHPFVPLDQAAGYLEIINELESWLASITGYDAVSVQPNSGAQGEFTGLLAIRGYHEANGEGDRDVCLIPSSAHGTNPASATMAGLKVVVVECDEDGNIDVTDLEEKAAANEDRLAAIMVTYPSTHGVFEEAIVEICDIVHRYGGQVYLDGANLNAMVGIAEPGSFGSDVSHLNLHKTFAIPHGGGGPGVGPIGVRSHLAPYLPGHGLVPDLQGTDGGRGAVSSAPWGSAGVLAISWMYIAMLGPLGLRKSTEIAILNANYIAKRLAPHYPVLYTGPGALVAHECIIDIRDIEHDAGITNEDIAKRLIDFGFHAPTMSFPVAGTLMVEPTESESKYEIDRFIDAMIAIKAEIDAVAAGEVSAEESVLRNAPHPAEDLMVDEWSRPYTREQAAYPVASLRDWKYWVPLGRIDNAYGDRNVFCVCPPVEDYED
ncbi:MAG: aminomethyl-transferring glycine dehydrogenase [Acidimicrobiia bacterium]|nr:MAG: aminomethyl-transferring glycine dehydrogenase [Acidimicrobiia bacterium]